MTEADDTVRRRPGWSDIAIVLAFPVAAVLSKLWLVGGQRLTAYGSLTIDDQWFVERAAAIRDGDWLGRFDTYTLIKQPGYPMFVALADVLHVPLLLAQQLTYALAVAVLVAVLAPALPGWRRHAAFSILLFNPVTMNTSVSARVDRSLVYCALLLLLLAGLIAVVDASERPGRRLAIWSGVTSIVLAAAWLLREEFLLVVPAVAVAVVIAVVRTLRSGAARRSRAAAVCWLVLVPASVPVAWLALRSVNDARYDLAVHNIEQTSVPHALGPMFRVDPVTSFDRYPVTAETRAELYAASPTFASLRDEIEGGGALRFVTTRPDGVEDLNGAVFQWVLLDAVHATGQSPSGPALDEVLRTIGREIDDACDGGQLRCGPPHVGIAPPFDSGRLPALARRSVYATWRMFVVAPFDASSPPGDAAGPDRALFERMTGEPLATGDDGALTSARAVVIRAVRLAYFVGLAGAGLWCAWSLAVLVRRRHRPAGPLLAAVLLGTAIVGARLVGLAYLDLTAFQALSPSYLAPAHAVAMAVIVVSALAPARQRNAATRSSLSEIG